MEQFETQEAKSKEGENTFLSECAKEIPGEGKEAIINIFSWLKEKGLITKPEDSIAISDPERFKKENDYYLTRSTPEIIKSGYTIACAEAAQLMVDILKAKRESARYVDTLSETFLRTNDKQGHMFIEFFDKQENKWQPFNPVNGDFCIWEEEKGIKYIRWKGSITIKRKREKFDEKYYYFKMAETPQAMGYLNVGKMQDIVQRNSPELRKKLGLVLSDKRNLSSV